MLGRESLSVDSCADVADALEQVDLAPLTPVLNLNHENRDPIGTWPGLLRGR